MMQQAFGIEARGAALDRHFTHQACLHQVTQIVISSGPWKSGDRCCSQPRRFRRRWGAGFVSIKKAITAYRCAVQRNPLLSNDRLIASLSTVD